MAKYRLICTDLFSDLGNQFVQLTFFNELVFREKAALSNLLMICLIEQGPAIFLSSVAGPCIDRLGPRMWLMIVCLYKCTLLCIFAGSYSKWVIFPVYICYITGSLFFNISRLTITPLLIPNQELISFNALNERISLAARIISPVAIGWIVSKTGQGVPLGLAGLLFIFSVYSAYSLPKLDQRFSGSTQCTRRKKDLWPLLDGYGEVFKNNRYIKTYFVILGLVLLGGGVLTFGIPVLFKENSRGDIADYGLILSGFQAGACLATFLLPRCSSIFRHQTILSFTFFVSGGAVAILGRLRGHIQLALLMILIGCGFTLIHIFLESLIQQCSPRIQMGKTMSILTSYRGLCYLGTALVSALVVKLWGLRTLLWIGSLEMAVGSVLAKMML